jgi:hypothetical protein
MAENREHAPCRPHRSSAAGNALPPTGKNLPPLPSRLRKARIPQLCRLADASPTQIGMALADHRLDHPQAMPSGFRTAGEG